LELADGLDAGFHAPEGVLGVRVEEASGLGEFDAAAGAVQERGPHFRFEFFEHGREGGLGDAQGAGRAGEVAGVGDFAEVAEWGEFHGWREYGKWLRPESVMA
jgi:hypothetical protein